MKSVVVIPAYNASGTIEDVINRIPKNYIDEIIIVDDGSNDDTYSVIERLQNIILLQHSENLGYGAAQITLYKEALKRNADCIVILHADGGLLPEEIPDIINPIVNSNADVVVGSRTKGILRATKSKIFPNFISAMFFGAMPGYKFFANFFLTALQNFCFGTNYSSFHCGYRAVRATSLKKLPFDSLTSWYQYDTEFLLCAHEKDLKIIEIPISAYYSKKSGSSVPSIKYGMRVVKHALKYALLKR